MNKSKKIFLLIALVFFAILAYIMYDMSSRTTFPGQKKNTTEKEEKDTITVDTVEVQE